MAMPSDDPENVNPEQLEEAIAEQRKQTFRRPFPLFRRSRIFISYRHNVNDALAGGLFVSLAHRYGKNCVFLDDAAIKSMQDFELRIPHEIKHCDLFVLLVGKGTLERIGAQDDWVRKEITLARDYNKDIMVAYDSNIQPDDIIWPPDLVWMGKLQYQPLGISLQYLSVAISDISRNVRQIRKLPQRRAAWSVSDVMLSVGLLLLLGPSGHGIWPGPVAHAYTVPQTLLVSSGHSLSAACHEGDKLLGGGYSMQHQQAGAAVVPAASFPENDHKWTVKLADTSTGQVTLTVSVLCTDDQAVKTQIQPSTGAPVNGKSEADCPAGMLAISGGYDITGNPEGDVVASGFADLRQSGDSSSAGEWSVTTTNLADPPQQIAYAVCVAQSSVSVIGEAGKSDAIPTGKPATPQPFACGAGQTTDGGSYQLVASFGSNNVIVADDLPVSDGTQWDLDFNNADAQPQQATVWPTCLTFPTALKAFNRFVVPLIP